jgi:hypothetical protein
MDTIEIKDKTINLYWDDRENCRLEFLDADGIINSYRITEFPQFKLSSNYIIVKFKHELKRPSNQQVINNPEEQMFIEPNVDAFFNAINLPIEYGNFALKHCLNGMMARIPELGGSWDLADGYRCYTFTGDFYQPIVFDSIVTEETQSGSVPNEDGQIEITVHNGVSPYEYQIDEGGYQANNIFSNLTAGEYSITVRDADGIIRTKSVTIKTSEV